MTDFCESKINFDNNNINKTTLINWIIASYYDINDLSESKSL